MTDNEANLVKKPLVDFIKNQKDGAEMEDVLDFLDYINKFKYKEAEVLPLLESLCSEGKLINQNGQYLAV